MSVVTGEAVALDLRVARAGSRALAFVLDLLILGVVLFILVFVGAAIASQGDVALFAAVGVVVLVLAFVGYPVTIETLTRGRSIGKLAMGLRVVRDDGGPIRFRQSLVRGLVGLFEIYLFSGVPALITSLSSDKGKRIGDYLAGTVVLQERVPGRGGGMVMMPPQLAGWAVAADLSGINDALALSVRQFLGRVHELDPAARADMENRLATAVAAVVAPPVPPGTPAWALLSAVAAERRRRESMRLQPQSVEPPPSVAPPDAAAETTEDTGGFAAPR